jgi:hypothetical protein
VDLLTEQPMPTVSDAPVGITELVRHDLRELTGRFGPETVAQLVDDLDKREAVGIVRYGVSLQVHNGRDPIRDAYEEVLDLCQYLRQAMARGNAEMRHMYQQALGMAVAIRKKLP